MGLSESITKTVRRGTERVSTNSVETVFDRMKKFYGSSELIYAPVVHRPAAPAPKHLKFENVAT